MLAGNSSPHCAGAVRSPQKCVSVSNVCFEAEQIILHGVDGTAFDRLNGLLNRTRDPSDAFSRLHPAHRPTVLLARPGDAFEYLPLAIGVKRSLRKRRHFLSRHIIGPAPAEGFSPAPAIAFYTTWSNSFTEIFSRAVVQLFELWCRDLPSRDVHLIPAMWGSNWGPDYARFWLHPFTAHAVEPMALTPDRPDVKPMWRALAMERSVARYREASAAMFAARTRPRCFLRATVCDYSNIPSPRHARPWAAMQAVVAFHAARPAASTASPRQSSSAASASPGSAGAGSPVPSNPFQSRLGPPGLLRVVLANRTGRRRLLDLEALVAECNGWRPPSPHAAVRVRCVSHNFGVGLVASLPVIADSDVMVTPHGADMVNAFALHRGSSVLEVMPVHRAGCPCQMYKELLSSEGGGPPAVLHYQLRTKNRSMAVAGEGKVGYNMDLRLPWPALRRALLQVLAVGGRADNYQYTTFAY